MGYRKDKIGWYIATADGFQFKIIGFMEIGAEKQHKGAFFGASKSIIFSSIPSIGTVDDKATYLHKWGRFN